MSLFLDWDFIFRSVLVTFSHQSLSGTMRKSVMVFSPSSSPMSTFWAAIRLLPSPILILHPGPFPFHTYCNRILIFKSPFDFFEIQINFMKSHTIILSMYFLSPIHCWQFDITFTFYIGDHFLSKYTSPLLPQLCIIAVWSSAHS